MIYYTYGETIEQKAALLSERKRQFETICYKQGCDYWLLNGGGWCDVYYISWFDSDWNIHCYPCQSLL